MRFEHTVVSGLLKAIPRGQVAGLVAAHGSDRRVRRLPSWSQLVALLVAQLAACRSLRELEAVLASQRGSHYHLGIGRVCRSTLAVANAKRPAAMFEALFGCLLERLSDRLPKQVGRETLRLLDATSIRLNAAVFTWSRFSADYGGVKLHVAFDPAAAVPTYFAITPNKINDITPAKAMPLLPGCDLCHGSRLLRFRLLGRARSGGVPVHHTAEEPHTDPSRARAAGRRRPHRPGSPGPP